MPLNSREFNRVISEDIGDLPEASVDDKLSEILDAYKHDNAIKSDLIIKIKEICGYYEPDELKR